MVTSAFTMWYSDSKWLEFFADSPERKIWAEEKAYEEYFQIDYKLAPHFRNPPRIGGLYVAEMRGIEGLHFWMFPIEGHKKLLAPNSMIALLDKSGALAYEGKWKDVDPDWLASHPEFFIWMKPREEANQDSLPLGLKIKGFIRYLLHKKRN